MKVFIKIVIMCLTMLGAYYFYDYTALSSLDIVILSDKISFMIMVFLLLIALFYINMYFRNKEKVLELRYRDKLFNSLVKILTQLILCMMILIKRLCI